MSINPIWNLEHSVSEAERGKFIPLDMSTTTAYPSSGRGKFAILVYDVGTASLSGSSASVLPNSTQNYSGTLYCCAVSSLVFSPAIKNLEIYNNSSNYAYINWNLVTYNTLVSAGLPIPGGSFYSIDRSIATLYIGANSANTDLRIMGHFTL